MVKNQTICLVNDAGQFHMNQYDNMPVSIRRRLANSPFNLCVACIIEETQRSYEGQLCWSPQKFKLFLNTIEEFEKKTRGL